MLIYVGIAFTPFALTCVAVFHPLSPNPRKSAVLTRLAPEITKNRRRIDSDFHNTVKQTGSHQTSFLAFHISRHTDIG
jgi:hypothetical protein